MGKVRYAIIGFGGIAENRIAKEGFACDKARFAPLESAELTGAFDLNPARKSAAEALGLKWYDSVEALVADPEIDAVYVATNNATHAAMTLKALAAGKHVIVEKPMATSIEDAEKMIAAAEKAGLSLSVDHMMVNNAFNRMAKECVGAGKLGTVNDSCFHMEFAYGYDPAEAATWRCSKVEEMGGPVGDVASHCFYMAEYVFGSPIVEVAACYLPKLMDIKAEDGAYVKFTLANGMKGSVKAAFSELRGGLIGTLSNLGYEIYGSEAVLRGFGTMFQLSGQDGEPYRIRLELENADGVESLRPDKFENIYQVLIEEHARSVRAGRPLDARNGLRNLKLCAATHESARSGGKVVPVK